MLTKKHTEGGRHLRIFSGRVCDIDPGGRRINGYKKFLYSVISSYMQDNSIFIGFEDFVYSRTRKFIIKFVRQKLRGNSVECHLFVVTFELGRLSLVADTHDKTYYPGSCEYYKLDAEDQEEAVKAVP